MPGDHKPYPKYRDSEVNWIGKYPSDWELTRVKFESYVKARVGWHGLKSDDFTDEGPFLVTGSDFRGPLIKWDDCYHCDLERYKQDPYIQLKEGDLLITKDGTIGKVALVAGLNGMATLNSGVFVVRPLRKNYSSRFYFWLLQASIFTGFVDFNKTGSTIVHLYQDTFVNFKFAMPSFSEQLNIASFLDHETTKIDTLIVKQQQLIQLLKEKRQAVISHAVTKGLNPNAKMRDSGVEWLGEVPAHWTVVRLKYHIKVFEQGWSPQCDSRPAEGDEYGVLKVGCVNHGVFNSLENKALPKELVPQLQYLLQEGDLLISRANTKDLVGSAAVVDKFYENLILCDKLYRLRFDSALNQNLVAHYLALPIVRQQIELEASGASHSMQNIGQSAIKELPITVPPINESANIVCEIQNKTKIFELSLENANKQIGLLQERRTAVISAAVTGKVDVRNWTAPKPTQSNKELAA
jgi:type I restriction enzyme, S subunit